jgi:hypothetical protein
MADVEAEYEKFFFHARDKKRDMPYSTILIHSQDDLEKLDAMAAVFKAGYKAGWKTRDSAVDLNTNGI